MDKTFHYPQTLLKNDKMFPCLGSFEFPDFLFPALLPLVDGAVLPNAGDFLLAAAGLHKPFRLY